MAYGLWHGNIGANSKNQKKKTKNIEKNIFDIFGYIQLYFNIIIPPGYEPSRAFLNRISLFIF